MEGSFCIMEEHGNGDDGGVMVVEELFSCHGILGATFRVCFARQCIEFSAPPTKAMLINEPTNRNGLLIISP